ncbi:MAG: CbtA family protein [Pseudonocardia sp.]
MVRSLLVRGMLAGLVAGLLACAFAWLFGEPALDGGIAYEEAQAAAAGEADGGEPLVSRGVQSTIGLAVAYLVHGVVIGGVLALTYASAHGRLGRLGVRGGIVAVALVGFVAAVLVPFLKFPPNPPASSIDDTIGLRTMLYVVLLGLSVAAAIAAVALARRLAATRGWWNAVLAGAGAYVVAMALIGALLPAVAETPADFPAAVLYDFRLAALGAQVVLWTSFALVFAALVHRATRPAPAAVG